MSRRVHTVVQLLLAVLLVVVFATEYAISVSSQSCIIFIRIRFEILGPQHGNITVKIDERFTTTVPGPGRRRLE